MRQKGFVPIFVLIGVLIVGVISIFVYSGQALITKAPIPNNEQKQATASAVTTATPVSAIQKNAVKMPVNSPLVKPTAKPAASLIPSQTPPVKKNTCDVNVIYGKMDGTKPDPLLVTLVYSFSGSGNVYMTGVQWDFDGDGNWDTDMKQSNGTMEHTYGSGGNYNVKLKLQASDGSVTDVCSKTVSLAGAVDVSLKGQLYRDLNCNNAKDSGEEGIGGVAFTIMSPGGLIYQNTITDQSGNYSFSKKISVNDSLPLLLSPADHNYIFTDKTVTLNSQNYSATIDLPTCSR